MKKLWIPALAGMMLWVAMTLTEAVLEMTAPSQAAEKTYDFTAIATFGSNPQVVPSFLADGPVISNDGTVVYSAGPGTTGSVKSSIFSSDGTVTRLLMVTNDHTF